jgi:hypothetical protein
MKKILIVLLALLCVVGLATAADSKALTPYVDKGNILVNAGIGWGGLSGGAEYEFARIDIGGVVPVTFGAAARAFVDPGIFYTWSSFSFGAGGFGTAHFGFKDVNLPSGFTWFSNFDLYADLGVGFASATAAGIYDNSYYKFKPGVGISTFEGVSYYLNDKLAINFEYGYIGRVTYEWNYSGLTASSGWPLYYSTIGVVYKL